jgi:AbrB family looped-hinge helix DNA binding protein
MARSERLVTVGSRGRIVIPAAVRRELGIDEGTTFAIRVEGRRVILETRSAVLDRLRKRYADADAKSLSRELVADRRAEVRRESTR